MSELRQRETSDSHVIIAGFGVPGRTAAQGLSARRVPFRVIELNAATVQRCEESGVPIIRGDARDPQVLAAAGITAASTLIISIPDDDAMLQVVEQARRLNPHLRIIARCAYTSAGLEATRLGATQVIVAEQAVARELSRLMESVEPREQA